MRSFSIPLSVSRRLLKDAHNPDTEAKGNVLSVRNNAEGFQLRAVTVSWHHIVSFGFDAR
jgi:hypothetical protein